ncbi:hypothetical protein D3C75_1252610 [compost metagenome]
MLVTQGAGLTDAGNFLSHGTGGSMETIGKDEGHHAGDRKGAGEVADEHQAPVAQNSHNGDPGTFVQ